MDIPLVGEIVEKIVIYAVAVIIALERVKRWRYKRNGIDRRKDNPGDPMLVPGKEEACIKHIKALSRIENELIHVNRRLTKLEK